jgi:hypothetical protein
VTTLIGSYLFEYDALSREMKGLVVAAMLGLQMLVNEMRF